MCKKERNVLQMAEVDLNIGVSPLNLLICETRYVLVSQIR